MRFHKAISRGVLIFGFLVATAGGCSKENTVNQDNSVTNSTVNNLTQIVGPSGGEIVHQSGARISVLPGALSEDTELSIGELPPENLEFALPSGSKAVSTIFGFQPHGQLFAADARISVPHNHPDPSAVRLLRASPGSDWQEVATTEITPDAVVRDTSTFSFYVAVVDDDGGSGGGGGRASIDDGGVTQPGCTAILEPCLGVGDPSCCVDTECQLISGDFLCMSAAN